MSAEVGDVVLVNVDPLLSGGATTAGAIVCRVLPGDPEADPEDVEYRDRAAVWVFADYNPVPVLRQDVVAVDVLPEPKKRDNGVRDLSCYAPLGSTAIAPAAEPAPADAEPTAEDIAAARALLARVDGDASADPAAPAETAQADPVDTGTGPQS